MTNIDLIYIKHPDNRGEMSCAICGDGKDKLIGPFPSIGAIAKIAPLLLAHLPEEFANLDDVANRLAFVHFHNMGRGCNSAGQGYPWRLTV